MRVCPVCTRQAPALAAFLMVALVGPGCGTSGPATPEDTAVPDQSFEFALLGDNPYRPHAVAPFESLIADVNRHESLAWAIHVGDIRGSGEAPCSDEVIRARFDLYQRFAMPFVFTPGDNDWFDCGSESAGGFDVYERLRFLRSVFFPNPTTTTGGRTMEVRTQASLPEFGEYVENVLWSHNDVTFATVHLVALTRDPADPAPAEHRMDAALAWIAEAFRVATEEASAGVLIATQVDPWVVSGPPDNLTPREGMERLYPVLVREAQAFGRPVVLAVGDTHVFRVDKPLYTGGTEGQLVENFTRVEVFGNPYVHWVRVGVDPDDEAVFSFHEEVVDENVGRAAELSAPAAP